ILPSSSNWMNDDDVVWWMRVADRWILVVSRKVDGFLDQDNVRSEL
ncbi:6671_t:CDS:2, partial [Paraglomus brasilianum]